MITHRKTQGMQVVSRAEGAYVGKLDDFQFDLLSRTIYGYRLKGSGVFAKAGGVSAEHLDQVGRDVAFVEAEAQVEWTGAGRNAEEGRAWASQYRGMRVMTRAGIAIGEVDDFVFDARSRRVLALVLNTQQLLELSPQVATGPAAVILEDPSALRELPPEPSTGGDDWWKRFLGARSEARAADPRAPEAKSAGKPEPQVEARPEPPQLNPEDTADF